jgi:O-antigen/teichoic acid export membrane protein
VVIVLNGLFPAFEHWRLLLPVALLAVAVIPYALAVPYSYALAAHGHEKVWLVTLGVAVVADAIAVALIARTATTAAALWLLVQIAVSFCLLRSARRLGFIPSRTRPSGMTSERLEGPAL